MPEPSLIGIVARKIEESLNIVNERMVFGYAPKREAPRRIVASGRAQDR